MQSPALAYITVNIPFLKKIDVLYTPSLPYMDKQEYGWQCPFKHETLLSQCFAESNNHICMIYIYDFILNPTELSFG